MHYNTHQGNWHPATITYWILDPRYKCIADIEDFGQLMPAANNWDVAVPGISLLI
jgi:hypothetical protein